MGVNVKMSIKAVLGAALVSAALAVPAAASVQVGSSGWQWGNPLPQGNTVRAMSFAGATGYAAGDFGTLLKTTDGGATWSGLGVGTFQALTVVQTLSPDVVLAGGGCVARRSTDGGRTFTAVRFQSVESGCSVSLRDLSFVSPDVGYLLLADGSVFATTDGGQQFAQRTAVPNTPASAARGNAKSGGIVFLDASKGFVSSGGTLYRTIDGGNSWVDVATAGGNQINAVSFLDAQHGFVVGDGGLMARTDDGGTTWTGKNLAVAGANYTSIRCADTQLCVLTTRSGTQLVRTTDAGDRAGTIVTPSTDPIYAAAFASATRVSAAGEQGSTVVSDDAGLRFAPIGGRINTTFNSLRAGGAAGSAFATGARGALGRTTDGGKTWTTGNVPSTADLLDVSFPTADDGYALNVDGGLYHTTSGGRIWATLGTGSTRKPRALLAPDAGTVLVVGPRGIRRSVDSGDAFDQLRSRAVQNATLSDVLRARGGAIFAWGPTTLVRSGDGGGSWTKLPLPGRSRRERRALRVEQVAFASARVGLLSDSRGRVWRTANAGGRWTLLTSVGTEEVSGIAVDSPRTATLVIDSFGDVDGGYLLRTTDAGATWQPQFVVNEPIQGDGLVSGGGGIDYLLAGGARLLFSTTGGVAGKASRLTLSTKRRSLPRARRITVTGRLSPVSAGAQVTVSALAPGRTSWEHQTVSVASNGTFVTGWNVPKGTTTFVAQWTGSFSSAGTGSRTMEVTVGGKPAARGRRGRGRARRGRRRAAAL